MTAPKKKTSADQTVATICQEALRGAAAHYAVVRSTVKIDDILTLFQRLTGRSATPEEIADLEEKMGQKELRRSFKLFSSGRSVFQFFHSGGEPRRRARPPFGRSRLRALKL